MNITPIQRQVAANTGPFATIPADPVRIPVSLPGPFVMGLQVYSSNPLDTAMRIMQRPGMLLFPDPQGRVLVADRLTAVSQWYVPIGSNWMDLRIVVDAAGAGGVCEVEIELGNKHASTAADVVINILAAANPPDEYTLELLRQMAQGIERLPMSTRELMREVIPQMLARQKLPGPT
jgi:hypothetical protein